MSLLSKLRGAKSPTDVQKLLDGIATDRTAANGRIEKLARERSDALLQGDHDLLAAAEEETAQLKRTIGRLNEREALLVQAKDEAAAAEARAALERRHADGKAAAKAIDARGTQWDTARASILTLAGELGGLSDRVIDGNRAGAELGLARIEHKADSQAWGEIVLHAAYPDRSNLDRIEAAGRESKARFDAEQSKYQRDLESGVLPTRFGSPGIHGTSMSRLSS